MLFEWGLTALENFFQVEVRGRFQFDLALLAPALDTTESVESRRVLPLENDTVLTSEAGDGSEAFQAHGLRGRGRESVIKTDVIELFRHLRIGVVDLKLAARGSPVHCSLRGQPVEDLLYRGGRREAVGSVLTPRVARAVYLAGEPVRQAWCPSFGSSTLLGCIHKSVQHEARSLGGKHPLAFLISGGRLPHARPAKRTRYTHIRETQAVSGLHAIHGLAGGEEAA